MVLLPLSHFFSAPMSEGIYLAMTLGTFYFAARSNFWGAALCGFLATMARTQGILLVPLMLFMLIEQSWHAGQDWRERIMIVIRKGYPLALIPLAIVLYSAYRSALGFRSLDTLYMEESFRTFVNPLAGLWINLHYWIAVDPLGVDSLAVVIVLVLSALLIWHMKTRHFPLTLYTMAYILVFLTPINYQYGTNILTNTQSFGRYSLILFPLVLMAADWLRNGGKWRRLLIVSMLFISTLGLSARHVLGILGP
jgi:Gpi18-like mannosyltransferase